MGNVCVKKHTILDHVEHDIEYGVPEDFEHHGAVHVLLAGLDYKCDRQTWAGKHPLDTRMAFDFMVDLCHKSEVSTIHTIWNRQCTRKGVRNAIQKVGAQCAEDDVFLFYYTGHGDRLKDLDGDEESGFDSALCLVGEDGNAEPRGQVWMSDDEFVEILHASLHVGMKVVVLLDCCHSETMLDVTKPEWNRRGYRAFSICGCKDDQTSAGTGKGGLFSRSIMGAIQRLQTEAEPGYCVSQLYNTTLDEYEQRKNDSHRQKITLHGCGLAPQYFVWPLQPTTEYVAPHNLHIAKKMSRMMAGELRR
eukprot:NODE_9868_length_1393_cov_18.093207.p1 GENE.NODE_9868_length_1393_cov_18.093207~~NODE_9868_length_1393_cov_18.093207.p1  ORF type:complete len:305 (+),score=88.69 NODE_9868_length_1393_cov_18.093207:121-1035(+)